MNVIRLKKGDVVEVTVGKDKGKSGKLLRVDRVRNRVVVEGLNIVKKTQKPRQQGEKGSIVQIEAALHASNVLLKCKKCEKGVRVGFRFDNDNKVRVCKKCGEAI